MFSALCRRKSFLGIQAKAALDESRSFSRIVLVEYLQETRFDGSNRLVRGRGVVTLHFTVAEPFFWYFIF